MKLFKLTLPEFEHTAVTEDGDTITLRNKSTGAVYAEATNAEVRDLLVTGHFYERAIKHAHAHKAFYKKVKSVESQQPKLVPA